MPQSKILQYVWFWSDLIQSMTIQQAILDIIFIVIIQILIIEFIDIFHSDILFFLWMVPIRTFDSFVKFQITLKCMRNYSQRKFFTVQFYSRLVRIIVWIIFKILYSFSYSFQYSLIAEIMYKTKMCTCQNLNNVKMYNIKINKGQTVQSKCAFHFRQKKVT